MTIRPPSCAETGMTIRIPIEKMYLRNMLNEKKGIKTKNDNNIQYKKVILL